MSPTSLADTLALDLAATEGAEVQRIETHISWVLLTPQHAYKLKKPVDLGFVDFSTLAARRQACEDELRLNRRLAPGLYLGVLAVTGTPQSPTLGGTGEPIDWVVKMRRFPAGALWSERLAAGTLLPAHIDRFAQRLAAFHADAPRSPLGSGWGGPALMQSAVQRAAEGIEALKPGALGSPLRSWLHEEAHRLAPLWSARQAAGCVRECHGDLHLANVVMLPAAQGHEEEGEEQPTAFDCLEFDADLRWIDVLGDTAFLVMDLWAHGRHDLAFRLLNAYLEHSGDYAGLPVLRHQLVYRALVRALVGLHQRRATPDYLGLARRLAAGHDPRLLITSGLPGSGKTHVTQGMLEAAGAIRLRSDVERKRLHGLARLDDSHARGLDIYTPEATVLTFAHLRTLARVALQSGYPTIVDAAFLKRAERDRFRAVARELSVPCTVLACDAPHEVLCERVHERTLRHDDASEAGLQALEFLMHTREPVQPDEQAQVIEVDTTREPDARALAQRWRSAAC